MDLKTASINLEKTIDVYKEIYIYNHIHTKIVPSFNGDSKSTRATQTSWPDY